MAQYRVYLCGGAEESTRRACPAGGPDHTPAPSSYLGWHEWAEEMSETHVSTRCEHCQRFGVWVAKRSRSVGSPV